MSQPNLLFLHLGLLPPTSNTSRYGSCTDHQYRLLADISGVIVYFSCRLELHYKRYLWRGMHLVLKLSFR